MTDVSMEEPGAEEPLILEKLSDLEDEDEYLAHFPDIRGRAVVNPKGDEVGFVDDLYVNPRDRHIEMAAITFSGPVGSGGRTVLVPVEEIQVLDGEVRIITHEERLRLAPEFHEGAPMYEPYYEYWSRAGGASDALNEAAPPPGRLELADEEEEDFDRAEW
jgi:sporulation protein YlmC with PRC-barrel domain